MNKRALTILAFIVVLTALIAACKPAAPKTLKVAILAPLSGDVATFGVSTRDGALLAIEEWNAKGGVLGRRIEALVEDSQCEAEPAASAANKVINQDQVKFIIGEVCSKASIPVSEIVDATGGKVLQISPTSTNPKVTIREDGTAKPTVFRACFIDPFQGTVAAKFALDKLGAKTAAVLLDQGNDYVRGLAEFFKEAFEAGGGKVVVWETYTAGDKDFSAILTKVKDANPDVLFLPDYYQTVNLIAAQANQMGIKAVKMGGDGWDSPELDRQATAGGFFTNHYTSEDTRPVVQDFVKRYQAKYGSVPDALAALAYDAANILFQAIQQAGTDDALKVAQTMEKGKFSVVSGDITFDAQHNPKKCAVILEVSPEKVSYRDTVCP